MHAQAPGFAGFLQQARADPVLAHRARQNSIMCTLPTPQNIELSFGYLTSLRWLSPSNGSSSRNCSRKAPEPLGLNQQLLYSPWGAPKLRPFLSQNRLSADYKSCSAGTCCKTFASISYKNRRRLLCLEVCNPKQDQRSISKIYPQPCSTLFFSFGFLCTLLYYSEDHPKPSTESRSIRVCSGLSKQKMPLFSNKPLFPFGWV